MSPGSHLSISIKAPKSLGQRPTDTLEMFLILIWFGIGIGFFWDCEVGSEDEGQTSGAACIQILDYSRRVSEKGCTALLH